MMKKTKLRVSEEKGGKKSKMKNDKYNLLCTQGFFF